MIKLKGVPSTSTSETSTSVDSHDLLRMSTLGLGVLHVIFGILVLIFGALRTTAEHEPNITIFGTLFGPVFVATGLAAFQSFRRPFKKFKMKVLFCLAMFSAIGSTTFVSLCLLGLVYFHSVPRTLGDSARVTANAIVATIGELVISLITVLTAGSSVWRAFQCGAFKSSAAQKPMKQKVIVKTNIIGSNSGSEDLLDAEMIRHISPNCVISLRATDEQREVAKRVEEYVRELNCQDDMSFTFSDNTTRPSSEADETELGVDSQNWRNEVLAVANKLTIEDYDDDDVQEDIHRCNQIVPYQPHHCGSCVC